MADLIHVASCEEFRAENTSSVRQGSLEKEKTMGEIGMAAMWIGAGCMLVMYLKRRRKRKTLP